YVTGDTGSADFLQGDPFPTTSGAFRTTPAGIFVTKLNADGSALLYSSYLGAAGSDFVSGIAVDAAGNAYVTGFTDSGNAFRLDAPFPTTPNAFQKIPGGSGDAFVTKLNATGSALIYSTFLGGDGPDQSFAIAVDAAGSAYVTGSTNSRNFPTTPGAFQTIFGGCGTCDFPSADAFVTKLNATGTALVYSTFLGGSDEDLGFGIAVDSNGS